MAADDLRYRLGTGPGGPTIEDGLAWAGEHGFHYLDFNADHGANVLTAWSQERVSAFRATCERLDLHPGLHTLSAVNVAEFSPYVGEGVDAYLQAYIDLAQRLNARHVIIHAGLHQSSELEQRQRASLERLRRTTEYAERAGVLLLLENLNFEPDVAEMHYMGWSIDELRAYFDAIPSPNLQWGFSANHAHLTPHSFPGYLDALGVDRIGLVLMADCRGTIEEHLLPGEGTMNFADLFRRLEGAGYRGPYSMTFGNRQQKLTAREFLLAEAARGLAG